MSVKKISAITGGSILFIGLLIFSLISLNIGGNPVKIDEMNVGKGLLGNFDVGSIIEDSPLHGVSIQYPLLKNSAIDKITENWIQQQFDNHKKNWTDARSELNISYHLYRYEKSIISVKYDIYNSIGGGSNAQDIITKTYNLGTGQQLALSDFFEKGSNYLEILSQKSRELLKNNVQLNDDYIEDTVNAGTAPEEKNYSRFIIDKKHITLFFFPGQITVPSAGSQTVLIPLSELSSVLEKSFPDGSSQDPSIPPVSSEPPASSEPPVSSEPPPSSIAMPESSETVQKEKKVALTFDDGPSKETGRLLDALKAHNAKATFFVLGNRVETYNQFIVRMKNENHQIGNHSYDHKNLTDLHADQVSDEIINTNKLINELAGLSSTVMRPPYGSHNSMIDTVIKNAGQSIILWNIDPQDWKFRDAKTVSKHILSHVKDGDIILLHDIYGSSVDAAIIVLDELTKQGYTFVTVDELIARNGAAPVPGQCYSAVRSKK